MKVYILYSNPYDEGAEIYGVFSTEEKVEKAREVFASKSNHELYFSEMEVDALEKDYERAELPERPFTLHRTRLDLGNGTIIYGNWSVYTCGLDSFLERKNHENQVVEFGRYVSASVLAKSERDAIDIAEKMIDEDKVLHYEEN